MSIKMKNVYLFYIEIELRGNNKWMLDICDQYNTHATMIGTDIVN